MPELNTPKTTIKRIKKEYLESIRKSAEQQKSYRDKTFMRDYEIGRKHGELYVTKMFQAKGATVLDNPAEDTESRAHYDLLINGHKVEVKYDMKCHSTGNLAVETESWGRKNTGINGSQAEFYIFVIQRNGYKDTYIFRTEDLRRQMLGRQEEQWLKWITDVDGRRELTLNSKGVLVPLEVMKPFEVALEELL